MLLLMRENLREAFEGIIDADVELRFAAEMVMLTSRKSWLSSGWMLMESLRTNISNWTTN